MLKLSKNSKELTKYVIYAIIFYSMVRLVSDSINLNSIVSPMHMKTD